MLYGSHVRGENVPRKTALRASFVTKSFDKYLCEQGKRKNKPFQGNRRLYCLPELDTSPPKIPPPAAREKETFPINESLTSFTSRQPVYGEFHDLAQLCRRSASQFSFHANSQRRPSLRRNFLLLFFFPAFRTHLPFFHKQSADLLGVRQPSAKTIGRSRGFSRKRRVTQPPHKSLGIERSLKETREGSWNSDEIVHH